MSSTISPPIVVVGPHRSGTTLTTQMMSELGVFVGARLDQNAESTYMQRLNRRVLDEMGSHWSTPCEARRIIAETERSGALDALAISIGEYLEGPWFNLEYWGRDHQARRDGQWGWKDPRNLLLFPLYRRLFPGLSVVWVRRHPMETARSLRTRESIRQGDYATLATSAGIRQEVARSVRLLRGLPLASPAWRTSTLRGAVEVSLEYAELHHEIVPSLSERVFEVDYDHLVTNPEPVVESMKEFFQLPASEAATRKASGLPRRRSSPDFRGDAELATLSNSFADRLRRLGYEP